MLHDLRFALRWLVRRPGYSLSLMLILGLGIGVNAVAFSLIDAVLLQRLPVANPDTLVSLFLSDNSGRAYGRFSYPEIRDLRENDELVSEALGYTTIGATLIDSEGQARRVDVEIATGNYFEMLGLSTARGRLFDEAIDGASAEPVAVLSHSAWRSVFGGRPMIGETVRLNGHGFTIIGIAPQEFQGLALARPPVFWLPITSGVQLLPGDDRLSNRGSRWLVGIGRLGEKTGLAAVQNRAQQVADQLAAAYPDTNEGREITVLEGGRAMIWPTMRDRMERFLGLLRGIALLVLLLTCFNVASLLLARAGERAKEIAMRLALGAGRRRLVRQLLVESLVVGFLGGLASLLFALATLRFLEFSGLRLAGAFDINAIDLGLDLRTLTFTFALALGTGILFGLVPALQAVRLDLVPSLKGDLPVRGGRTWVRNGFTVAQLTLSFVLLITAGLFLRTLDEIRQVELGFQPTGTVTADLGLDLDGYDSERSLALLRQLRERLQALPGVQASSYSQFVPVEQESSSTPMWPVGKPLIDEREVAEIQYNVIDDQFFEALGATLVSGRSFRRTDEGREDFLVVVNEALAAEFWPGEDAVGRRLTFPGSDVQLEVIGVAPTTKTLDLREDPRPYAYFALFQTFEPRLNLLLRAEGDPMRLADSIRSAVREVDPNIPLTNLRTLDDHLEVSRNPEVVTARLFTLFGVLALLLAAVGVYGVISFLVAQRRREIAIRLALGEPRQHVIRRVLGQGVRLAIIAVAVGLPVAWGLGRLLEAHLYGVRPMDVTVLVLASVAVSALALVATLIPALRAASVQPAGVLRGA